MKVLRISDSFGNCDSSDIYQVTPQQLPAFLKIVKPHTFESVRCQNTGIDVSIVNNKEFWKNLFLSLQEDGSIHISLTSLGDSGNLSSFLKMNGFTHVQINDTQIVA